MEKSLNILIVDNDPAQLKTLQLYLQGEGQTITATLNPHEAYKIASEQNIDLMIVDLVMPEMDGVELICKCREQHKTLPAILITGHQDKLELWDEDVISSFQAILPKPLDIDRLVDEINRFIRYGGQFMNMHETKELLAQDMQRWMVIENQGVASTTALINRTSNPVVRLIMEIILQDSLTHYNVQEFIKNSMSDEEKPLTEDDLVDAWILIERHRELERRTVESIKKVLENIDDKNLVIQMYLLNYLLMDENKHDSLLSRLDLLKMGLNASE